MQKELTFQQFLSTQSIDMDIYTFVINLILATMLAYVLRYLFVSYANTSSNKKYFANNFVLLTLTTMLVITIVKTSLALSLGLIGALSIVRFRAPIKEPEELVYLFLTIGVGLGFGANQRTITLVAFCFIVFVIFLTNRHKKVGLNKGVLLTISSDKKIELNDVIDVLDDYCDEIDLQRYDSSNNRIEISFVVNISNYSNISDCNKRLEELDNNCIISVLDYRDLHET